MTQQLISQGTGQNTGTGDTGFVAFQKVNANFTELYPAVFGASSVAVPGVPTSVFAYAGPNQITVTWKAPLIGQPTSYTVTVSGATTTVTGLTATITGLTNGNAYIASVVATNSAGNSASATATAVTPKASGLTLGTVPTALTSVSTGLLWAWYATDQLPSPPTNGNPLVSGSGGTGIFWNDASGNGRDITVAAAPPVMVTAFRNSKPALQYDGAAKYLLLPFDTTTWNGAVTFFAVCDIQAATSADAHIIDNRAFNGTVFVQDPQSFYLDTGGAGAPSIRTVSIANVLSDSTTAITIGNVGVATVFGLSHTFGAANGGGNQYFSGTKSTGNLNAICSNVNSLFVGARGNITNLSRFYNGRIAELIFFTGALSDTDRHTVETYLGTKYNVTMASQ